MTGMRDHWRRQEEARLRHEPRPVYEVGWQAAARRERREQGIKHLRAARTDVAELSRRLDPNLPHASGPLGAWLARELSGLEGDPDLEPGATCDPALLWLAVLALRHLRSQTEQVASLKGQLGALRARVEALEIAA